MTKISDSDELETFKSRINLVEYALSVGYEVNRKRTSQNSTYMSNTADQRIVIATSSSGHGIYFTIGSDADSGSIIDFVQNKQGLNLGQARKALRPFAGLSDPTSAFKRVRAITEQEPTAYAKPKISDSAQLRLERLQAELMSLTDYTHDYLLNRCISEETIAHFSKQIKQDSHRNACFMHRDSKGQITGWEKKNNGFTGFSSGGRKGLFIQNADDIASTHQIIVFESAIDAMSFHQLQPQADNKYVAVGGSPSTEQLQMLLDLIQKRDVSVYIATDNDETGDALASRLVALLDQHKITHDRLLSKNKDWNDDLKEKKMGFKINTPKPQKTKKTTAQTVVLNTNQSPESSKSVKTMIVQVPAALQEKAKAALKSHAMQEEKGNRKEEDADDLYALDEVIDIDDYMNSTPDELDFLWEGGMLVGTVGALIAPGGAGKSFFGLAAGLAISAHGAKGESDILKLNPTKQGVVNYYVLEDPKSVLRQRLHAIRSYISDEASEEVKKNLKIRPMVGKLSFDFVNPDTKLKIIEHCRGSRLIIIDTLSRAHTYDENKNGEMSQLLKELEYIAEQTGAAVLFLHHTSKSSAKDGEVDAQQAARGASALIDNARWAGFVQTMTKEESERVFSEDKYDESPIGEELRGFYVRYGVSKQNYSKRTSDVWFERQKGGVLIPVELEGISKKQQKKNMRGSRRGQA